MTRMTENLPFCVTAIAPSGLVQGQNGRVSSVRQFLVQATRAEEFGLRMLGKWRGGSRVVEYEKPQLPAYFPYSKAVGGFVGTPKAFTENRPWPFRMIATGFSITPVDECCFNSFSQVGTGPVTSLITDAESIVQAERYYAVDEDNEAIMNSQCKMQVTIQYDECPWDCTGPDNDVDTENVDILEHTAISVERSSAYTLQTLPNRNLVWEDLPGPENQLKGDTFATIIIPTADITVDWYNIPLSRLCEIEAHLSKYRNRVNCTDFTILSDCMCIASQEESCNYSDYGVTIECQFEPETVLFIDWEELKEQRTRGFRLMDTTTLRLVFKQRRIDAASATALAPQIVGWNHLYCDSTDTATEGGWRRVGRTVDEGSGPTIRPLYEGLNMNNMFDPDKNIFQGCPL